MTVINQLIKDNIGFALIRRPGADYPEIYSTVRSAGSSVSFVPFSDDSAVVTFWKNEQFEPYQTLADCNKPETETQETYRSNFDRMHALLVEGKLQKIILSRVYEHSGDLEDYETYFFRLCKAHPNALCYVMNLGDCLWIGATPELLLSKNGSSVQSNAVAGTATQQGAWTGKELDEHQIVVDYICDSIEVFGSVETVNGPLDVKAGPVYHLVTEIKGKSDRFGDLLEHLNPTPAVCGVPKDLAYHYISEIENRPREYYTGYIHLSDPESDYCYVNLRCMKVIKNRPFLFLGGGITAASDADAEWKETMEKAKTLLIPMENL